MTSREDFKDFRDRTQTKLDELAGDLKRVATLDEIKEILTRLR